MMNRINLFPWREEERRELKRRFLKLALLTAVFTLLVQIYVYRHYQSVILDSRLLLQQTEEAHILLNKGLVELANLQKQQQISSENINTILQIQQSKYVVVNTLSLLPSLVPNDLFLNELNILGSKIVLTGTSTDMRFINTFADVLKNDAAISKVEIDSITSNSQRPDLHDFSLSFRLL
ncbi:PilN domain-containing protein [Vibrio algarum]|uniref:PilN domain-containing protein n=1 Tax=Vibrio algarum TaxID=3020714 RepID=A0ABT4YLE4_9VIBR|nr:PilN domain-containing protein [Vibrio sp. KJ40-1]MDB1122366.1 PilN domain-containing protein [Vibrio sp. KJ40-1]